MQQLCREAKDRLVKANCSDYRLSDTQALSGVQALGTAGILASPSSPYSVNTPHCLQLFMDQYNAWELLIRLFSNILSCHPLKCNRIFCNTPVYPSVFESTRKPQDLQTLYMMMDVVVFFRVGLNSPYTSKVSRQNLDIKGNHQLRGSEDDDCSNADSSLA